MPGRTTRTTTNSFSRKKRSARVPEGFISLAEAAQYCTYSQEYLSLRARQGILRAQKFGRNWYTKREWLEEYVSAHHVSRKGNVKGELFLLSEYSEEKSGASVQAKEGSDIVFPRSAKRKEERRDAVQEWRHVGFRSALLQAVRAWFSFFQDAGIPSLSAIVTRHIVRMDQAVLRAVQGAIQEGGI